MADLLDLETRVSKIEAKAPRFWQLCLQYLVGPVLVVMIGFALNAKIEVAKQRIQNSELQIRQAELEIHQIDAAQRVLDQVFTDIPEKGFAAVRLMGRIVEKNLATQFERLATDYYKARAHQVDRPEPILDAAKEIGGPAGEQVIQQLAHTRFHVVVASRKTESEAVSFAKSLRASGYQAEVYLSSNEWYAITAGSFELENARSTVQRMVSKGDAPPDTYISSGKPYLRRVYPAEQKSQ